MEGAINIVLFQTLILCVLKGSGHPCQEFKTYRVESKQIYMPSLEEIVKALENNLTTTFKNVEVSIVDCPDLRKQPFLLAAQGLCGSPTLLEAGSDSNLIPVADKSKIYEFEQVPQQTGVYPTFIIGATAGPFLWRKAACELTVNMNIARDGEVHSLSQVFNVDESGKMHTDIVPNNVTYYSLLSDLFVSQGAPGKVIKVKVSKRIGDDNFAYAIRQTIKQAFPEKIIGLGGTFLIKNSRVYSKIQPPFTVIPPDNVDSKFYFFNVSAPMVAVGVLITGDPGLDIKPYHFHMLFQHSGVSPHYIYDQDKDTVEYHGYFTILEKVVRVDRPTKKTT